MSLFKVTPPAKITRLRHCKGQSGQALAEVALILALICVVTIVAMTATGTSIDGLLDTITGILGGEIVPEAPGGGDDTPGEDVGGSSGGGGGAAAGALSMPAGTTQGALVNLADDGTITAASSIGANTYRVLSMSGGKAKLLKMQAYGADIKYNASSVTTSFGGTTGQKYEGSNLDSVMNTFYESLPETIKAAIVPQTIKQSKYSWSSDASASSTWDAWQASGFGSSTTSGTAYNCNRLADITVGERYVYALDVDDVVSYFQAQGLEKTPQNLAEMFWNVRSSQSKYVWLRSASSDGSRYAFSVSGNSGNLNDGYDYLDSLEARPAFIINIAS